MHEGIKRYGVMNLGPQDAQNVPRLLHQMSDLEKHVTTSTFNTCHFHLKPPFELVLFAFDSFPWDEHLAWRKSGSTRGNLIWTKLKHGAMDSVFHAWPETCNHSCFNLGPQHMCKLVCFDKTRRMECKTTRFHPQVIFSPLFSHGLQITIFPLQSHEFRSISHVWAQQHILYK